MNDLKLLNVSGFYSTFSKYPIDFITFDQNMNLVYVTDHQKVFKIENNQVILFVFSNINRFKIIP